MILYGMGDPVEAIRSLAPHVMQVHIKDALPAATPGEWGSEVPVGEGAVDWDGFFDALAECTPDAPLMIEREAGENRVGDIESAHAFVVAQLDRRRTAGEHA
jgi:sugar phosphate isomerase/epimerase